MQNEESRKLNSFAERFGKRTCQFGVRLFAAVLMLALLLLPSRRAFAGGDGTDPVGSDTGISETGTGVPTVGTSGTESGTGVPTVGTSGTEPGTSVPTVGTSGAEPGTGASAVGTSGTEPGAGVPAGGTSGTEPDPLAPAGGTPETGSGTGETALETEYTPAGETEFVAGGTTETTEVTSNDSQATDTTDEPKDADGGKVTIAGMIRYEDGDSAPQNGVVESIPNITTTEFVGDGSNNVLQQAIDAALSQVKTEAVIAVKTAIILSVDNGSYTDDITMKSGGADKLADMVILVASDAFSKDDAGNAVYTPTGDAVHIGGNVQVESIRVLLYGLYLSVEKAVKAKDSDVTIVGTTGDDVINAEVTCTENGKLALAIDGGEGNDTVKVTQTGEHYLTSTAPMPVVVDGGAGSDTIDVSLGGRQTVYAKIDGGAGNDQINVSSVNEYESAVKTVEITDLAGDNTITATLRKNRTDLSVLTGDGNDSVSVKAESDAKDCRITGIVSPIQNPYGSGIATGGGNDRITLSTTVASALSHPGDQAAIVIDAGDGADTLSLTGSLKKDAADCLGGDKNALYLRNDKNIKLNITLRNTVERFVDDLANKPGFTIERIDAEGYALDKALRRITPVSFYTYYINKELRVKTSLATEEPYFTGSGSLENDDLSYASSALTLRMLNPQSELLLSILNINIDAPVTISSIQAPGMALQIYSSKITMTGDVYADSIYASAYKSDSITGEKKIDGKTQKIGDDNIPDSLISFFTIKGDVGVNVGPSAFLHVSDPMGQIELFSEVSYTRALLNLANLLNGFNFANVKLVSSVIDISGRLDAGIVRAGARATATLTASNSEIALLFMPVSVSVGVIECGVRVHGTPAGGAATINAAGEVTLDASSTVTVNTTAGTGKLPVSVAVSVVDNTVYCKADENAVIISGGAINLKASGDTKVINKTEKGQNDESISGGFIAVSTVLQSVKAGVYGNAALRAAGKININALAKEKVVNTATSASAPDPDFSPDSGFSLSLDSMLKYGVKLLGTIGQYLGQMGLNAGVNALTKSKEKINGTDGYSISMDSTEHGSLSVSAAKAKEGEIITVNVSADKDYKLKANGLKVTYRPEGAADPVSVTLTKKSETSYTFTMPKGKVSMSAVFESSPGSGGEGGGGSGTKGSGIKDIVNNAAANNSDANRAVKSEAASNTKAKTVTIADAQNGAAIVDVIKLANDNSIRVLPNKTVRINVSPTANHTIDTLKVVYDLGGTAHEIVVSQNMSGEYVFTMPDANVTVKATFKEGTPEETGGDSSFQLTGALAVCVAENAAEAMIDTTGTVISGADVIVFADTGTDAENKADASQNGDPSKPDPNRNETDVEVCTGRTITEHLLVAEMRNGSCTNVTPADGKETNGTEFKLTFTPRLGYEMNTVKLSYKDVAGADQSFALEKVTAADHSVYYRYLYGKQYENGEWKTPKYGLAYTSKYVVNATFSKVGTGDTVTLKTADGSGAGSAKVQVVLGSGGDAVYREGKTASKGANVIFTLLPGEGQTVDGTYTVLVKDSNGNSISYEKKDSVYGFVMPNALVTITAKFIAKPNTVTLTADKNGTAMSADDVKKYLAISDTKAVANGETFTVALTEAALLEGLRLSLAASTLELHYNAGDSESIKEKVTDTRGQKFAVKLAAKSGNGNSFTLHAALKLITASQTITAFTPDAKGNTVTLPTAANPGDTITITPKTAENYKYKNGSLIITIEMSNKTLMLSAVKSKKNGVYTCTLPTLDPGQTIKSIKVAAEFAASPGHKKQDTDTSVGVGIAVNVVESNALATIRQGTLTANGLTLKAENIANSSCVAKAGYSAGDFGLAGSIAVNVANADTQAILPRTPEIVLGNGSLILLATGSQKFVTNADSAGQKMQNGTGVGAAIAVGVFGVNTKAIIEENARIVRNGDLFEAVTVAAKNTIVESSEAKAGSSGGTAITPVIAVAVTKTDAEAWIAPASNAAATLIPALSAKTVTVSAENNAKRTYAANASAAGAKVGVGASFVVTYIKDYARARLSRDAAASKKLSVTAKGISRVTGKARAGANGAAKQSSGDSDDSDGGEADKQAAKSIGVGKKLQGSSVNTSETGKQKAQTAEGSVSVAAAFILNIQTHIVESCIDSGAFIWAETADVVVQSVAQLTTELTANGAATVAKIGVGVAVALNIASYQNIASVEEAYILAKSLTVSAVIPEDKTTEASVAPVEKENYIRTFVRSLLKKFLNTLASDSTLSSLKSTITSDGVVELMLNMLLGENNCNLKALLSGTGLEPLLESNPATTFMKNFDTVFGELKAMIQHADYDRIKGLIKDEIVKQVVPVAMDMLMATIGAIGKGLTEGGVKAVLKNIAALIVDEVKKIYADLKDPAGMADKLTDLFISATKTLLKDVVDLEALKKCVTGNLKDRVIENLKSYLSKMGMALTNAVLDKLSSYGNVKLTPALKAPAHTFYTYAIAGAGATDVGVAGSVAIAVLNGETRAILAAVDAADAVKYRIQVSGDTLVRAESVERVETIASSAVGDAGKPEKNDTGDSDSKKSTDTAYTTENVSLPIGGNAHSLYLTTGNATVEKKESTDAAYTVTYKAKDGYRFTDKSVSFVDIDKTKVETKIADDGLSMTVKLVKDASLKATFTVKVTGVLCDERTISTDSKVAVTGPCDVEIALSTTKAHKTDRVTVTFTGKPVTKDEKVTEYTVVDANLKKAVAAGFLTLVDPKDAAKVILTVKDYSVDKKGNLVFAFLMPDQDVKLKIDFSKQGTDYIYRAEDPKAQPVSESGKGIGIGAAFAFTYGNAATEATVGANRRIESGTFWLDAAGGLEVETIAVSGTDPIATHEKYYQEKVSNDAVKKISIDAGVAFAYLGGTVLATVASGALIETSGGDTVNINKTPLIKNATDEQKALAAHKVNFAITTSEWSETEAKANAFAAGSQTAVGACVAINYIDVASGVEFHGTATTSDTAEITAKSVSRDAARGMATAMGADMARYCKKFTDGAGDIKQQADKITNGEAFNGKSKETNNETAKKISTKMEKSNPETSGISNPNLPVSTQGLRSQKAGGDATEAIEKGNEAASKVGAGNKNGAASASYEIAAAVAVNITAHAINILLHGDMTFGALTVVAHNAGNFSTLATGAAMSLAKNSNAIAAAVAVSVNQNQSNVLIADGVSLVKNDRAGQSGDITVTAETTQNITEEFSRYMTAQSLAGAISGADGKYTVAGAVSIVVAKAETKAVVGMGVTLAGGDVAVTATDRSRLAVRAGAISVSKGSARGAGASFAMIYAGDALAAEISDNCTITGRSFTLLAEKYSVNSSDYTALDWRVLFTNSSDLTDTERARAQTGIIDVHKTKDGEGNPTGGYTVDVNISSDTVLELVELLNFLSAVNYYTEAITGTVTTGSQTQLAASGSFALLFIKNTISATVGDGVIIRVTDNVKMRTADSSRTRVIAGSLAAGPAKTGAGLTVGFVKDTGAIRVSLGKAAGTARVDAGDFAMAAENARDALIITVAIAAVDQNAVGGAVTVSVVESVVSATIGKGVSITTNRLSSLLGEEGGIAVTAVSDAKLMLISTSIATAGKVAAGGTIAAIYQNAMLDANVGENASLSADTGSIRVSATAKNRMLNILASASAALSTGTGKSVAGAIGLLCDTSKNRVGIGNDCVLRAKSDIDVLSSVDSTLLNLFVSMSVGASAAIGLTLLYNQLEREATVTVGDRVAMTATAGNIQINALGREWTLIVGVAIGASTKTAIAGTNGVTLSKSIVRVSIGNNGQLTAGDSIALSTNLDSKVYAVCSGVSMTGGGTGVGETVNITTVENVVETLTDTACTLIASGNGYGLTTQNRNERRKGIYLGATATERMVFVTVSGSAGTQNAAVGTVHVLYDRNRVKAQAGVGSTFSAGGADVTETQQTISADVTVEADDDTSIIDAAGGLAASAGNGFGATALVLVFGKTVLADVANVSTVTAAGNVGVTAKATDVLVLLALGFSASAKVALAADANVLRFANSVQARLGGNVTAGKDIVLSAETIETMVNIVATVAGSGTAGVGGAAILTFYDGKTETAVTDNSVLTANGGISILADSKEYVTSDGAGFACGGTAGVGGMLDFIRTKITTRVLTGNSVRLIAGGDVLVSALDDYQLLAIAAMIAVGGTAGVGVVAVLSMHYNNIEAAIGTANELIGRNLSVLANSKRDFQVFSAALGAAGTAGIAASVAVLVAGGNVTQDVAETVLGMSTVGGTGYTVYADTPQNPSGRNEQKNSKLYRNKEQYYTRGDNDIMTPVSVTKNGNGSVTYNGKAYYPVAMNPQSQIDGVLEKTGAAVDGVDDVDDTLAPDGVTAGDMGGGQYDNYANPETASRANSGNTDIITDDMRNRTDIYIDPSKSRVTLHDGTSAVVNGDARMTAKGNIEIISHDLLQVLALSGSLAGAGTVGIGAGIAVAKLYSTVLAEAAQGTVLSADGNIVIRAITGTKDKTATDTFCEITNQIGNQQKANEGMASARAKLIESKIISGDAQKSSIWLIGVAGAIGGTVGVGASGAVLLFYTNTTASLKGTVVKAQNLAVEAQNHYTDIVTALFSAAVAGTVGVGVAVGVVYLEGTTLAEIGKSASVSGVTGSLAVSASGKSAIRAAAAAVGIGGIVGVAANVVVITNRNVVTARIASDYSINVPTAAVNVSTTGEAGMKVLLITVAGGVVGVGASVLICMNRLKTSAYIGADPADVSATCTGSIAAAGITVTSNAICPVNTLVINLSAGLVAVGGVVALTFNRAVNTAVIHRIPFAVTGDVTVTARLEGETVSNTCSLAGGLVAVALVVSLAEMKGKNSAFITLVGDNTAGGVTVTAGPLTTTASAKIYAGGAGLISISVFVAIAVNESENRARISGSGTLVVQKSAAQAGPVSVEANGGASAETATVSVTFAAIDVKGTATISHNRAKYIASMELDSVNLTAGDIGVTSNYASLGNGTTAQTGTPGNVPDISLANCTLLGSVACSGVENAAFIGGAGNIHAKSLSVNASTKSNVGAYTRKISVSLAQACYIVSLAQSNDSTSAYVSGDVGKTLNVVLTDALIVNATSTATVLAESITPLKISVVSIGVGTVMAKVGDGETNRHTTLAYIGRNVSITAMQQSIIARSSVSAKSRMLGGYNISVINIDFSTVPARVYVNTEARVDDGSTLIATRGDIIVHANSDVITDTLVDGLSVGALVAANVKYATNEVYQRATAVIGSGAALSVYGSLSVIAEANATMTAVTNATTGGLFSGGDLTAKNKLVRDVSVTIGSDATLFADFGGVNILARAGEKDMITTHAKGEGYGLVGIGSLESKTDTSASVTVMFGSGVSLTNTFGTTLIGAYVSEKQVESGGDYKVAGLAAAPEVRSFIADVKLLAKVEFTSGAKTGEVRARNLIVEARIPVLQVKAQSAAEAYMFGGSTKAYSKVTLNIDTNVQCSNASLAAYDDMNVIASATPDSYGTAVNIRANAYSGAVISKTVASAILDGNVAAGVTLANASKLTGAHVSVITSQFAGTVTLHASAKKAAFGPRDEIETNYLTGTKNTAVKNVAPDTVFHIADAAAGIVIDYYVNNSGNIKERSVGMPGNKEAYALITATKISLKNVKIENVLPGVLTVEGADLSACMIYGQRYTEHVTISNHTDALLEIGSIETSNEAFTRSAVTAGSYSSAYQFESPTTYPLIEVITATKADVFFTGRVNNELGTVRIAWTGSGVGGNLTTSDTVMFNAIQVAPIWANKLSIVNANTVGTSEKNPFETYLSGIFTDPDRERCDSDPIVEINAVTGYCNLSLTDIVAFDGFELPDGMLTTKINGTLRLDSLDVDNLYLTCGTPFRMYYAAKAEQAVIILPGVVEFTPETVMINGEYIAGGEYMFALDAINRYFVGKASAKVPSGDAIELRTYSLPNGMTVYLVDGTSGEAYGYKENELYKISGQNVSFDTTKYQFAYGAGNNLTVTFTEYGNAVLNLETGEFVAADVGTSVYIVYDETNKKWILHEGDRVVDEQRKDCFKIVFKMDENGKYCYDASGHRIPVLDASGNVTVNKTDSFGKPLFSRNLNGVDAYFYLMYTESGDSPVYYLALDKDGKFIDVYMLPDANGWDSARDVKSHGFNPGSGTHTIDNFMGVSGLKLVAEFGRKTLQRFYFKKHTLTYHDIDITSAVCEINGFYTIDYQDLCNDMYWFYSYFGGAAKNEETMVNWRWLKQETNAADGLPEGTVFDTADSPGSDTVKPYETIRCERYYDSDAGKYDESVALGDFMGIEGLTISWNWTDDSGVIGVANLKLYTGTPGDSSYHEFILQQEIEGQDTWYSIEDYSEYRWCMKRSSLLDVELDIDYYSAASDSTLGSQVDTSKLVLVDPVVTKEKPYKELPDYEITYRAYQYGTVTNGKTALDAFKQKKYVNLLQYNDKYYVSADNTGARYLISYTADVVYGKMNDPNTEYKVSGAFVHLMPGQKIRLYKDSATNTYRVFENLWVDVNGVITKQQKIENSENLHIIVYDGNYGSFALYERTAGEDTNKLRFLYSHAGPARELKDYRMMISGNVHLERMCKDVACDMLGRYYYKNGAAWKLLTREEIGKKNIVNGYTVAADGSVTVYWNSKKAFSTAKTNGKWVHSIYDMTDSVNALLYSVDENGVVSWGTVKTVGVEKWQVGGADSGSYGINDAVNMKALTVEEGAALAVDAQRGDFNVLDLTLKPGTENGPFHAPHIPGGKLLMRDANNITLDTLSTGDEGVQLIAAGKIEIGDASTDRGVLDLHAETDVNLDSLTSNGAAVNLTAVNGSVTVGQTLEPTGGTVMVQAKTAVTLGDVDAQNSVLTITAGTGVTMDTLTIQGGAAAVKATSGTVRIVGDAEMLNSRVNLTAESGDIRLSDVNAKGGSFTGNASSKLQMNELIANGSPLDLSAGMGLTINDLQSDRAAVMLKTATGDINLPHVDVTGDSLTVASTFGNVLSDEIMVNVTGDVGVTAGKDILLSIADLGNGNVRLQAGGDIASDELSLFNGNGKSSVLQATGDIDIANSNTVHCGPLTLDGNNVSLRNNFGDVRLKHAKARGDLLLVTDGCILDASGSTASDLLNQVVLPAQKAANDAQFTLQEAKLTKEASEQKLTDAETALLLANQALAEADRTLADAKEALRKADPADKKTVERLLAAVKTAEDAQKAASTRQTKASETKTNAEQSNDQAVRTLVAAQTDYTQKKSALDVATQRLQTELQTANVAVRADGNVTLRASDDIGRKEKPLTVSGPGNMTFAAGNNASLFSYGQLKLAGADADSLSIVSVGGMENVGGGETVHANEDTSFFALNGNIGSENAPMKGLFGGSVSASGQNVFLKSPDSITAGKLTASGAEVGGMPVMGYLWIETDGYFERNEDSQLTYGVLHLVCKKGPKPVPSPVPDTEDKGERARKNAGWSILYDASTTVSVAGNFEESARLVVISATKQLDEWQMQKQRDTVALKMLTGPEKLPTLIDAYYISVLDSEATTMTVDLPASQQNDGASVYVLAWNGERYTLQRCRVTDGYISFTLSTLKSYLLLFNDRALITAYLTEQGLSWSDVAEQ